MEFLTYSVYSNITEENAENKVLVLLRVLSSVVKPMRIRIRTRIPSHSILFYSKKCR
jgi:hypothetical protein